MMYRSRVIDECVCLFHIFTYLNNADIIPGNHRIKFCNNWPTFNEVIKICHDVKKYVMTYKLAVSKICKIPFLFAFIVRIFCHQSDISTMLFPHAVIDDYVFLTLSVTLIGLYGYISVIFIHNADIIPSYHHIKCNNRPTFKLWYCIGLRTCRYTNSNATINLTVLD